MGLPSSTHLYTLFLQAPHFPINVLNAIKAVPEVCTIFAATANPLKVIVAQDEDGNRGVMGVIDGLPPKGVETEADKKERRDFVRMIGYKR